MTETIFEISTFNKPSLRPTSQAWPQYNTLLQSFCTTSYSLYTEFFIKKIADAAHSSHPHLLSLSLTRNLRRCVKKFMLTDLQLIFLALFCQTNNWCLPNLPIPQASPQNNQSNKAERALELLLDLHCFFVKSYVGDSEEFEAVKEFMQGALPEFDQTYRSWIETVPKNSFIMSPRQVNDLYRKYSRNCQQESSRKDYNELVNTIIDLSTTYSIIPSKKGEKKAKQANLSEEQAGNQSEKGYKYESGPNQCSNNSELFNIIQYDEPVEDNDIPRFGRPNEFVMTRNRHKSSAIFESMQSLSRKSQIYPPNYQPQQKQNPSPAPVPPKKQQDKKTKPNKISLNFRKNEKPNETVLGFLQQSGIESEKSKGKDEKIGTNREINMSFINMRSNRSSKSNSHLPFLWKPSEDNFFQKSKFG